MSCRVFRPFLTWFSLIVVLGGAVSSRAELPGDRPLSFRTDVQAAIAKAGCNLGSCHGNATGKGGFKMSLRGDDADYDYAALVHDVGGRRINLMEPDRSLLLQKGSQALAHEGGKRFSPDSWEYQVLRQWIAQGAQRQLKDEPVLTKLEVTPREQILIEPANEVQIKASATFSNGTVRDVTALAVYEPAQVGLVQVGAQGKVKSLKPGESTIIVRYLHLQQPVSLAFVPARPEFAWKPTTQHNFIDRQVFARLKALRMNPSELASDAVYARRVYLDLLGVPPTAEAAQAFVRDRTPDKRVRLIDQLMARQEFADFWALKWADSLRVESRTMDMKGMNAFYQWIRSAVATNKPMNEFAHDILAASGSTYQVPEANFYRAMREPNARAEGIARVFLGTRLQCAQCHNHPFDRWTQDDYYDWAAVFSRIGYKVVENKGVDTNDTHAFNGEQIVELKEVKFINPRTGDPAKAKFLGSQTIGEEVLKERHDLQAAADWVVSEKNPFFAAAQVNRIWAHLMGRGLVEPVDDFRATNPASHPELLRQLSAEFVQSGYDARHIIRLIIQSRTYQLSSEPNATNAADETAFSHAYVRRLSAEQLFDSMHQFTGVRPRFDDFPQAVRASQIPGPLHIRNKKTHVGKDSLLFLQQFGQPPRMMACECERSNETTMGQSFTLIGSPAVSSLLRRESNALGRLVKKEPSAEQMVTDLFWSGLARAPSAAELKVFSEMIHTAGGNKRAVLEDLAWTILNSKEFVLRY